CESMRGLPNAVDARQQPYYKPWEELEKRDHAPNAPKEPSDRNVQPTLVAWTFRSVIRNIVCHLLFVYGFPRAPTGNRVGADGVVTAEPSFCIGSPFFVTCATLLSHLSIFSGSTSVTGALAA